MSSIAYASSEFDSLREVVIMQVPSARSMLIPVHFGISIL